VIKRAPYKASAEHLVRVLCYHSIVTRRKRLHVAEQAESSNGCREQKKKKKKVRFIRRRA